jgi:3-(3-hydroxy-phenyl)propionate hydroxylase
LAADPVLVAGAGPGGLATALGLVQRGVPVVLVEAEPALTHDLRAGSFHPPTVEMFGPLGVLDEMLAMGLRVPVWQVRERQGGVVAEFRLELLSDETPYPFRLHCEQHKLTRLLHDRFVSLPGAELRFTTRFVGAVQDQDGVTVAVAQACARRAASTFPAILGRSASWSFPPSTISRRMASP